LKICKVKRVEILNRKMRVQISK
ncbi:hypothetical protein CLOP_g9676, partial [Closterium sp. NIES-67]